MNCLIYFIIFQYTDKYLGVSFIDMSWNVIVYWCYVIVFIIIVCLHACGHVWLTFSLSLSVEMDLCLCVWENKGVGYTC